MKNLAAHVDTFRTEFADFLNHCRALAASGVWNTEEYGDIEAFYTNDLASVMIRLSASDGEFSESEAHSLNGMFAYSYTAEEYSGLYESCRDRFDRYFDENFLSGYAYLQSADATLAEEYRGLLASVCSIIMESDNRVSPEEIAVINRFRTML